MQQSKFIDNMVPPPNTSKMIDTGQIKGRNKERNPQNDNIDQGQGKMVKNQMRNLNLSVLQCKEGNTNAIVIALEYDTIEEDLLDSELTLVVNNTINAENQEDKKTKNECQ